MDNNYTHDKLWDEIIHPFPNFNSAAVEVWNRNVISSQTLQGVLVGLDLFNDDTHPSGYISRPSQGVWLRIHACIKIKRC